VLSRFVIWSDVILITDIASALVTVKDVDKRYGGVKALSGASLELRAGEVHVLVGENGAGKSTLARVLAGIVHPDAGTLAIDGEIIRLRTPLDAQKRGIGMIHQELDLFAHLTVAENMVIGNLHFPEMCYVSLRRAAIFCRPFLEQVGLHCEAGALVASLSVAQQQLLAIARSLSMNVRVLIMDEPTSALPEEAAGRLFGVIAALKARGVAVVYVSHKMPEIFRLSDRITVLRDGRTIGTRDTAKTASPEIVAMMVGRSQAVVTRAPHKAAGPALLKASHLTTRKLRDVSFEARAGEVLGLAGLVGAGRSSIGAALFGLDPIVSGSLRLAGELFKPRSPADSMRRGLNLLPEDRKLQGLMMQMGVRENVSLSSLSVVGRAGFIRKSQEAARTAALTRRLHLKSAALDRAVSTLSGGNQQKTVLARVLMVDPQVLFLDDPARGIDVGAKEDIYRLIDEFAAQGKAIILVSSELAELFRCADRILVLNQGRVAALHTTQETSPEAIMAAATGLVAPLKRVS
jgi:ABC-type sugar transport system ATPase subunit